MEQQDLLAWSPPETHRFGSTFNAHLDESRLNAQQARVWAVVKDGGWYTLRGIADITGDPEASVSARLRDLRNMFGCKVTRLRKQDAGTWIYSVRRPGEVTCL